MKLNFTELHKFLFHIALNIGPQQKYNEDIEENLKEGDAEDQSHQI